MKKLWTIGAVTLALAWSAFGTTACQNLAEVAKIASGVTGSFKGTVKDPSGSGLSGATIRVFKRSDIEKVTSRRQNAKGETEVVVDMDALAIRDTVTKTTSDTSGNWEVKDLKVIDGPYVIVATNERGKDVRGIDRDTRQLLSGKFESVDKLPEINVNSVVFPLAPKTDAIEFTLPAPVPPAPPPADTPPTPEPPAPTPTPVPAGQPTPAPPKAGDTVLDQAQLSKPKPASVTFGAFEAKKVQDGIDPGSATSDSSDNIKIYKFSGSDLENTANNKVLLTCSLSSGTLSEATLKISRIEPDGTKSVVSESKVSFSGGKLVSDNSGGYVFAVPRDRAKYVFQLKDGAGAFSNAVALDASALDPAKVRPFTVIMTWALGGGTDVDLHVFDKDRNEEAWFGNFDISGGGSLDLDNTEGYGPETFTGPASTYYVAVNYWYGEKPVSYSVRVITKTEDKTYSGTLQGIGKWSDIGKFVIQ